MQCKQRYGCGFSVGKTQLLQNDINEYITGLLLLLNQNLAKALKTPYLLEGYFARSIWDTGILI